MVEPVSWISSSGGKRQIIILIGGGFRGKQSKMFETLSSLLFVINGPLNISYQEGFSDG